MKFDILTIFPDMLKSVLWESIIGRANDKGLIDINFTNIRDFAHDKHNRTDDIPYGGGFGMVMLTQPITECINCTKENILQVNPNSSIRTIYMSPQGKVFNQNRASELSKYDNLIILCGHYEGIDQRVIDSVIDEEISIGDYILTGGELPAAILVDTISRLIPGVLKDSKCYENESIASGLLEYPQYTRPPECNGQKVPDVLTSGHHANIEKWRRQKSLEKTYLVRPDLLEKAALSKSDLIYLEYLREKFESEFDNG